MKRCSWAESHPLLQIYHDTEWGVPVHNDQKHFEFLVLDAFQAGLSWLTILKKRENLRKAFSDFDFRKVVKYTDADIAKLLNDEGIIRNRLKIEATINNAKQFIEIIDAFGSFDKFIWSFTNGKTIVNNWNNLKEIPAKTEISDKMSKALLKRGFKFVGSTICYAYMQAAGIVNDHETGCFRYSACKKLSLLNEA
jgi:DNA-3-methyladenine glycosylase I